MPKLSVQSLKKGMKIGNANRILYTVIEDAVASPYRTTLCLIEHHDGRRERREWLHDTQVHVYSQALSDE